MTISLQVLCVVLGSKECELAAREADLAAREAELAASVAENAELSRLLKAEQATSTDLTEVREHVIVPRLEK